MPERTPPHTDRDSARMFRSPRGHRRPRGRRNAPDQANEGPHRESGGVGGAAGSGVPRGGYKLFSIGILQFLVNTHIYLCVVESEAGGRISRRSTCSDSLTCRTGPSASMPAHSLGWKSYMIA